MHTTGPLVPGPPSVPMGPFEQKEKILQLDHQSSAVRGMLTC